MPQYGTRQSKFRFTADTLEQIDALKDFHGLESRADLIRYAVSRLAREDLGEEKKNRKKSDKLA
jgi:hypothetical protein